MMHTTKTIKSWTLAHTHGNHPPPAMPVGERDAWEKHLAACDVPVESRITWPRGGTSLYLRDPDGSLLELATPGLWPSW